MTKLFLELLILLSALVILSHVPAWTFAAWLFLAPFLQVGTSGPALGHHISTGLYAAPTLMFVLWLAFARDGHRAVPSVDFLPATFVLVAALSVFYGPYAGTREGALLDQLYRNVIIGVIAYYFCAIGPVGSSPWTRLAAAILGSSIIVSGMTFVERLTGWTLWGDSGWHAGVFRVVGPLANPAVLGTFLGAAVAVATAILAWNGPRSLRKLSLLTLAVAVPALYFTYTRAPIIATVLVVVIQMALRPGVRAVAAGVLVIAAVMVVAEWGSVSGTSFYQRRVTDTASIHGRVLLTRWSLKVASEHPLTGTGYGSFDTVKNAADLSSGDTPASAGLDVTSHDTFLTDLVELGGLGLVLLIWPWLRIVLASVKRAHRDPARRWLFVGWLGVVAVYLVNAVTIDMRFFSFAAALPWIGLGLLRRAAYSAGPAR
jgi:O-antigen polymerase